MTSLAPDGVTTFTDTLHTSPELVRACISCWNTESRATHNSLRKLRLVSKSVGRAALKEVQQVSLRLGDRVWPWAGSEATCNIHSLVRLVSGSHLRTLSIILDREDEDEGVLPHIPKAWSQLQTFIQGIGPALHTVTQLHIYTWLYPNINGSAVDFAQTMRFTAAASSVLAPLAKACPLLKKLQLDGDIGMEALSAFGASCPLVDYLDLSTPSIPISVLHHLHNVFPNLGTVRVQEFDAKVHVAGHEETVEAYSSHIAHALSSCTNLTFINLKHFHITESSTWTYLPPCVKILMMGACEVAPPAGFILPALEVFHSNRQQTGDMPSVLGVLASVVQSLPNLHTFYAELTTLCEDRDMESIVALHKRTQMGLAIVEGLDMTIRNRVDPTFFLPFPVLPLFTSLSVFAYCTADGMREVVRVFPNLLRLDISRSGFSDDMARQLFGLTSLRLLEVSCCKDFTDIGALICLGLPCLEHIKIKWCGVSGAEVLQGQAPPGLIVEVVMWEVAPQIVQELELEEQP